MSHIEELQIQANLTAKIPTFVTGPTAHSICYVVVNKFCQGAVKVNCGPTGGLTKNQYDNAKAQVPHYAGFDSVVWWADVQNCDPTMLQWLIDEINDRKFSVLICGSSLDPAIKSLCDVVTV